MRELEEDYRRECSRCGATIGPASIWADKRSRMLYYGLFCAGCNVVRLLGQVWHPPDWLRPAYRQAVAAMD